MGNSKFSILDVVLADKGYYINLSSSTDRNKSMIDQINKFSVEGIERFEALTDPYHQYSCTKSHLEVFKNSLKNEFDSILVFEDDAEIMEQPYIVNEKFDLKSVLIELSVDMNTVNWDVILLGCNPKSYLIPETGLLSKVFKSTGGWAYIIKKNAYKYILENSNYHSDYIAIDDWLPKLSEFGFGVYATSPIIVHHAKGFVSTLQPKGPVDYTVWINDNYHQFLYGFILGKKVDDFINDYKFELNTTVIISGYYCEDHLFYLKHLLKSCPDKLLKCKFLIIYDDQMGTKNQLEVIHYLYNRRKSFSYEILFSKTGSYESLKIALEKIKTKYMVWLEHDYVFLKNDIIDFNKLYSLFEEYNFINSVWFGADENEINQSNTLYDKNGNVVLFREEERISEISLINGPIWSNSPMILKTSKMREWFYKYIDCDEIDCFYKGQQNISDNIINAYKNEISKNSWENIKDIWGTYIYGKIEGDPICGYTNSSKKNQDLSFRTKSEEYANIYITENKLTEHD
jgi:GR25 family glycosyltransferase involved in LPS biosynthesis